MAEHSPYFHQFCLSLIPESTQHKLIYSALACGSALENDNFKIDLQKTSLLHLFIVSGSHLIFINSLFEKLLSTGKNKHPNKWAILIFSLLFIYVLMTKADPPVVRALISLGLSFLSYRFKFFWKPLWSVFLTSSFCLILFPDYAFSISFMLSWLAAFAMALASELFPKSSVLLKSFLVYAFMSLPFSFAQVSHPLSILFNTLLGPVIGEILFPLTLLGTFLHPAVVLFDALMNLFMLLIHQLSQELPTSKLDQISPTNFLKLWGLLFLLHGFFHIYLIHRRRLRSGS